MSHTLQLLSAEIHRYGGEIDRYEGDGLVAFFGLSTAHEDDAERAEFIDDLQTRFQR